MTRRGILFVGHDASRAGAQMALLHFLRWLKKNGDRPFSVLLLRDGELRPDFEKVTETWSIDRSRWCPGGIRSSFLTALGLRAEARRAEAREVKRFAMRCSPGLFYVNSIASAPAIEMLTSQVPILTHVHELEFMFRTQPKPALSRLLARTGKFIACSNTVRENLLHGHAVPESRIETIHEAIPVDEIVPERTREEIFKELEIPNDAVFVVAGGTPSWRKGTDLFVQLAREVCQRHPRARFAWVGDGPPLDVMIFEHDLRLAGLAEKVRLTGSVLRPADYFAACDVFALTSREDPYPLVCLEAAALGKPIVCFADAGGIPEFVEKDCGFVVPYLDVMAMSDRVLFLLDSAESRRTMGAAARNKVTKRHDIATAASRIMEIIERYIAVG